MHESKGTEWALGYQKRTIDLLGITALMPAFVPYGLYLAAKIHKEDSMNPLFSQTRYGLRLDPFTFHKFRTMPPEELPNEPSTGSADDRRTKLGSDLSAKHLDEIPQSINIYNGSMSLVGPRPLVWKDIEQTLDMLTTKEQREWLTARNSVKPGVFGEFQLNQHDTHYELVGEEELVLKRAEADIRYAKDTSYATDKNILIKTAISALNPNGEHNHGRGESVVKMLDSVANGMGIATTELDINIWRANLLTARYVDDLVDEQKVEDLEEYVLGLLRGDPNDYFNPSEIELISETFARIPHNRLQEIISIFLVLPAYASAKRNAKSATELSRINDAESRLFAELIHLDPNQVQNKIYNAWVDVFASTGYMADLIIDNEKDYFEGNVGLKVKNAQKILLGGQVLKQSISLLTDTLPKSLRSIAYATAKTLARS